MDEVIAGGFRGHIQNMSAASLLQIINMDRQTCTLRMATPDQSGELYIRKGEVVDARSGELRGERAALAMLAWPYPTITIDSRCRVAERTIDKPLTFLIMEALRLADEQALLDEAAPASSARTASHRPSLTPAPRSDAPASQRSSADAATACIAQFPLSAMKALALALIHTEGQILAVAAGARVELSAMAKLAGSMLSQLRAAQVRLASRQAVEEVVFTASGLCYLVKPLVSRSEAFVLLVFNPHDTSLAIRRTDLDELVRQLETDAAARSP
jgi:hypothetical protein